MPKNDRRELTDDMLNDVNGGMESSEATEAENITLPGGKQELSGLRNDNYYGVTDAQTGKTSYSVFDPRSEHMHDWWT